MRRNAILLSTTSLVVGVAVGLWLGADQFGRVMADRTGGPDRRAEVEAGRAALRAGGRLLADVARTTTPGVVHIQSERRSADGGLLEETGSGAIVRSKSVEGFFVVTNRHVIRGAELDHIAIHLHDGRVVRPTRLWKDAATDLAVLRLPLSDVSDVEWANSDHTEIGQMVLAMGSPFGLSQSVTLGIISAKGRRALRLGQNSEVLNQNFLQTDAAINPGNSGGPLIDLDGRIVGINTAIASNSGGNDGIGFSIPANLARRVVEELLANGHVQRAFLGVKLDPIFDEAMAHRLRLDRVRGARITQVYPDTPAARADLIYNDVVLVFNGTRVHDESHLINLVSLTPVDEKVTLGVWRAGRQVTVPVVLSDRSDLESRSEGTTRPGAGVDVRSLGLTLHRLDGDTAAQLGFDRSLQGLLVLRVEETSPLRDRVRLYDIVESVGGVPVETPADVESVLRTRPGTLPLLLSRREAGRTLRTTVNLDR